MTYRITGLSPQPFLSLYGLPDEALAARGAIRYQVNEYPGFPDRITMRDVEIGQTVLLLNHVSQPADTPYRASHAIFVQEGATAQYDEIGAIPDVMKTRLLSLRAYAPDGMMLDAEIAQGANLEEIIKRLLSNPEIEYIHAHNATRGCYSGRIERAA